MRSRHLFGRPRVSAPGAYANRQAADHADEHAEVRGKLRTAMQNPKDVENYLHAQAEHARVSDEVYAVSDGRVAGSGTEDRRGHRDLHRHFAEGGNIKSPYSGPQGYYPVTDPIGSQHNYQHNPVRAGETVEHHPHQPRDDGKPGGWHRNSKRNGWAD